MSKLFRVSCLLAAIAIGLNALAAHALSGQLSASHMNIFDTASKYLLFGSLWLMVLTRPTQLKNTQAIWGLVIGLSLFCGSLLLYLLLGWRPLMMITPLGGLILMGSFVWLGISERD